MKEDQNLRSKMGRFMVCVMACSLLFTAPLTAAETETEINETNRNLLTDKISAKVSQCRYEKKEAMKSIIYYVEVDLTNESDEEIMEVKVGLKFYDDQGTEIFSGWDVYNGQDTPAAPGENVSLEIRGRMDYPEEPASYEVSVLEVYTSKEKPPIHIPQKGGLLYQEYDEEHIKNITSDMPTRIDFWIDRMGALSEAEIEDEATISRVVDAFSQIEIGQETWEVVTDNYNGMIFTFEDGAEICISLNLKNLEYRVYNGVRIYELEHFDNFWTLMNELTENENL